MSFSKKTADELRAEQLLDVLEKSPTPDEFGDAFSANINYAENIAVDNLTQGVNYFSKVEPVSASDNGGNVSPEVFVSKFAELSNDIAVKNTESYTVPPLNRYSCANK